MIMNNKNEIYHLIDGFNVIEYPRTNIYIIENIFDDKSCQYNIDFIEKLPLTSTSELSDGGRFSVLDCNIGFSREFFKEDDELYYLFNKDYDSNSVSLQNNNPITTNKLNGISKIELKNNVDSITDKMILIEKIMNQINNRLIIKQNVG